MRVMRQAYGGVVGVGVDDAAVKDLGERRLRRRRRRRGQNAPKSSAVKAQAEWKITVR